MNATQTSGRFHDHFSELAARYADFRPRYPAALFEYLTTLVPAESVVWDCACGSGQATVDLAKRFQAVFATDASAEQVASAKPQPGVQYSVALAEQSGLPDGSVDLVTVAQAMHWFDLGLFYHEVKRVLRQNGVVAAWAYGINDVEGEDANRIALDYYSNIVGPYWPPERKLVEQGYRGVPFPFAELLAPQLKLEVYWTLEQLLGYYSSWSATNRFIKANGRNPIPALAEALSKAWPEPESPRLVSWQIALRVGRHA